MPAQDASVDHSDNVTSLDYHCRCESVRNATMQRSMYYQIQKKKKKNESQVPNTLHRDVSQKTTVKKNAKII